MNENYIMVGICEDENKGYYQANWINDNVIFIEKTPEKAIMKLLQQKYPFFWYNKDKKITDLCPSKFIDRNTGEFIDKFSFTYLDEYKQKVKDVLKKHLLAESEGMIAKDVEYDKIIEDMED